MRDEATEAAQLFAPCPLEAGLVGRLADHECEHGRLDGDRSAPCGCWKGEDVRSARRMEA